MNQDFEKLLFSKISRLSEQDLLQIMNFADFLSNQEAEAKLKGDYLKMTIPSIKEIWDNDEDAFYDKL